VRLILIKASHHHKQVDSQRQEDFSKNHGRSADYTNFTFEVNRLFANLVPSAESIKIALVNDGEDVVFGHNEVLFITDLHFTTGIRGK